MLALIARWFSLTHPSQEYRHTDYVLLWLILVIGAGIRFWGLGNVGFHGDEETMAMPAMAILETGHPYLPSGMYYSRALLNIYLMSGSVWMFGESEWAFRLPSAIVGSLTGVAAFFMGRRFLSPPYNLAFVATVTLLPGMIVVSQTARMYVFFVTCMIWFAACLFRWERDQRISSLVLALAVWALALHFQRLAIFAAPLFLFPGLARQSWKQLVQGGVGAVIGWMIFELYGAWIMGRYPQHLDRPQALEETASQAPYEVLSSGHQWLVVAIILGIVALAALLVFKAVSRAGWRHAMPPVLIALGLLAMTSLQYHVGGIMLLLGTVFWLRARDLPRGLLIASLVAAVSIAIAHFAVLHATGLYPGRRLIGAVVGIPSIWPVLRFLEYSPFAGVVYGGALLFALHRLANGWAIPCHFLFFVLAVWIPLLLLGFFASYIPLRYAQGQLGYFLLCAFAGIAFVMRELKWTNEDNRAPHRVLGLLVMVAVAMVNPVSFARALNPSYGEYPDHKGAAGYIRSLDLPSDAILIAEDVLQQTYYLGKVDYWLRPIEDSRAFSIIRDGRIIDQYTGSPVLGSGSELEMVLDASGDKDIYIIGSGENFFQGKRGLRGEDIARILESDRVVVVYEGRDGKTKVWRNRRR